jgi:mandelate racemase
MPETLTVRNLRLRAVNVPLSRPLRTAGGVVSSSPLLLIDLETEEGITGSAYLFTYTDLALQPTATLLENLLPIIQGEPVAPAVLERKLQGRFRLLGPQGLTGMAMAGIDMAAWDALAKAAGMPLVRLLGGVPRLIPAYNSCGLGMIGVDRVGGEARELAEPGYRAIKVRLGYPDARTDVEVIRTVREAVGPDMLLMTDYNQSLSVAEAVRRAHLLDDEGVAWIEEPVSADDLAGHAQVAREARTPVQTGENWWGPHDMAKSLAAGGSDLVMVDAMKIGGVTGWLRAAALAEAAGLPMSSHLFPEISVHLLAVTPTCHWLEYMDLASPILQQPLRIENGQAAAPDAPGTGLAWDEDAVRHYSAL